MATGHKLVKEITDQFLHCKICYEPYKEPKTLTCLHTFCSECIQKHVDSDTNRSSRFLLYSRYITCPLCRSKTEIPSGGVRRLPDNFLLSNLNEVLDRKCMGKSPPCEICPGERPRGNNCASHKCLDCAKLLCKSCVDLHMTTKVTQKHSLIDIEGEKDIECKKHPEEIVRYYCEPCEECVCVVCTFQEHRDHEICSFSDGFSKYRSGLDSLLTQCKDRLGNVQSRLSVINNVESALKVTRENIRDLAISYISQVRQTERQLVQRVEEEFGSKVQGFLQSKEWLQENMDGLQTTCNLAELIMNDRGVEMLLLKRELQNKLSTLLEPALPQIPENVTHNIKFVPGNVQLGHISWNSEDDTDCDGGSVKHALNEDGNQPRKRHCVTRDTQTSTNCVQSPVVEVTFDLPTINLTNHSNIAAQIDANKLSKSSDQKSKTDVSVNTMCSMEDVQESSAVCVKCCAELKKDFGSSSSLPVIDGNAPTIQDIIITNADGKDRRRRRSLIKSRRVQTDISLSNESLDDVFAAPRVLSQESLNGSFRKLSQNSLTAVAECVITSSIGLDPIDFGPPEKLDTPKPILHLPRVFTRNKGVNTTEIVKVVPDSRSVRTNTIEPDLRESSTMTLPSARTVDTQTLDKISVSKAISTDYTGQRNKRTSTPIVITMDNTTYMPPLTQESKVTWTDSVQTTERSVCTEMWETMEIATETNPPSVCDQGTAVRPETRSIEINTDPVQFADLNDASTNGAKPKERKTKTKDKEKKEKSSDKKTKEKKERREKKKYVDSCVETAPVLRSDKETGTIMTISKDSWTSTISPQMVNTGVTPARPITREASVATNPVVQVEQGTHTEVIKLQDSASETIVVVCDGETLTERVGQHDAQTSVDLFLQSVETITDECYQTDTGCMTDAEWFWDSDRDLNVVVCDVCQDKRAFVDTGTSPIEGVEVDLLRKRKSLESKETQTAKNKLYDKSIATSFEFVDTNEGLKSGILCSDVSTSTDNLPYIGLLSDMECDELILVPDISIDVFGSDTEYMKAYTNSSFPSAISDSYTQTIISSAILNGEMGTDDELTMEMLRSYQANLITVAVNTDQKRTFEKETCTPSLHQLTKGTNTTSHTEKSDKSTSTGSHVRTIQENFCQSPVAERSLKMKVLKRDVSVETDNSLLDEKMIACINKLKTVSDRLNSPTTKMFAESMPWGKPGLCDVGKPDSDNIVKDLEKATETERKRNVMELVAKSHAMKTKEPKTEPLRRKAQPLTTLKTKYQENDKHKQKPPPLQRQESTESNASTTSNTSKSGSKTPATQKRSVDQSSNPKSRSSSASGRMATAVNSTSLKKAPPKVASKPNPNTTLKPDASQTPPATRHQLPGPDFYSTVPKVRHPKHGLASITENRNRHSSTGSDQSDASFRSAVSEPVASTSSLDKTLDFSSLKITVPPRAPSASPTPPRHGSRQNGRVSRQATSTNKQQPRIEVTLSTDESPETMRMRTGSTSSDQTDNEPSQEKKGFMKKLFGSKKKKTSEKRNASPSKSPKPGRRALPAAPEKPEPESPKAEKPKEKPKPFVYMRSRIFSIEQKDDEKYNKPIVNKYCVNKEDEKPPVFDFAATFTKKK